MRRRSALVLAAVSCATSLIAVPSRAHIDLEFPEARAAGRPDSNLRQRPCGQRQNARREDRVNVFRPGESIDLALDVYVQHESYFRFAFDVDGDDSFSERPSAPSDSQSDDPTQLPAGPGELILGYVRDPSGTVDRIEQRLTLPNVECASCTLQVIQFTYGLPLEESTYYQCADIELTGPLASPEPDPAAVADPAAAGDGGGCSLRAPSESSRVSWASLLASLLVAGWRRRRAA